MSLSDIYTALSQSLTGTPPSQSIDLYLAASNHSALTSLKDALALLGITSSPYTLAGVSIIQNVSDVLLTGSGTWGIPGADPANESTVRVQLIGTSPNGVNQFSLALAITTANWTFSTSFPVLPDCQIADENQAVVLEPSFLIGMPFNQPVLIARSPPGAVLQITGELPLSSTFEPWADMFAPWPLRAAGTLTLPATVADSPAALEITALAPSATITAGALTVKDIGLRLSVFTGLDPALERVTELSVLDAIGTVEMGSTNPINARLSMPLLAVTNLWQMTVQFETDDQDIDPGLQQISAFLGVPASDLLVPSSFLNFLGFYLTEVEAGIIPPSGSSLPGLQHVGVTIGSKRTWPAPIPYVRVEDVGTRWVVGFQSDGITPSYLTGCVYGTVRVGGTPPPTLVHPSLLRIPPSADDDPVLDSFAVTIAAYLPSFVILGELAPDDEIPIGAAFRYFFLNDPGPPTATDMKVTAFRFEADPRSQTYTGAATVTMDWTVPLGVNVSLKLVDLNLRIAITQGQVTGGISGDFVLVGGAPPGLDDPYFNVMAEYTGSNSPAGWTFAASLYPSSSVELVSLVSNFLGITPPTSLPTLTIERLAGRFSTGSGAYTFSGTIVGRWSPQIFGTTLAISAEASADVSSIGTGIAPQGTLLGKFSINRISITVGINLKQNEPTYLLKVQFGDFWISATTAWRDDKKFPKHQVITLQLGGVTVGAIIEYLVNLAAPTLQYQLDTPWDVLNRIDLSRFQFTIDPTENSADFVFEANADLIFAYIETIGVRYVRTGGEPDVSLILTGRFLTRQYTLGNPLSWNVLTDPPPAVPGGGSSLLELRYLGVGQRVGLTDPLPDTVRETIARLRKDMKPPADPRENPLEQSSVQFQADSEWLIGLDARILDTLDLGIVFNDPRLYGLSIDMSGERAGPLAGFSFEILYKKITDDIGMFRIELQVPEAFRHIELGEVSITLGIIVVEIYTNGNFLVDLGFPYNRNFERSFTVQVFPFIGRGGIYFGLLNGSTSRRVPAVTNGTFDPVLELGIGLAVGVGRDITVGPLSGGIFVEVQVIFQGVLGWFNPTSSAVEPAKYYWVQGTAAIYGKLYGKIDFKIIKVQVSIEAWAQVSVILEAYRATIFRLNVGVKVEAEVTILFISISFSFDTQLDVSFTVGSDRATPWILASGQGTSTQSRLRSNILPSVTARPARRAQLLRVQHLAAVRSTEHLAAPDNACDAYNLNWNAALAVFTDSPRKKDFTLLPAFLVTEVPLGWSATPPTSTAEYRVCFMIFAPNGIEPGSANVAEAAASRSTSASAYAADTNELTADTVIEAFLRWSISAVTGSPGNDSSANITAGQMQLLLDEMTCPQTADSAFTVANLRTFFTTNLWMELTGDPGGSGPSLGGMAVPIPPFLSLYWTSTSTGSCNFANQTKVGPLYEWGANAAAAKYYPLQEPVVPPPPDDPLTYESYASFIFRDWCLMVAKAAVQSAQDAMNAWPLQLTAASSLTQVAALFPTVTIAYTVRAGDTVDSVAASLGSSSTGLLSLNPTLKTALSTAAAGSTLQLVLGVTPEMVAISNSGVTLITDTSLTLGDIDYQVASGDTLSSIATHFGFSQPSALFTGTTLSASKRLLNPGSSFPTLATTFTPPSGYTALLTAAVFFPRFYGIQGIPNVEWYAQTVFTLNADRALATWNSALPIPAGTTLLVPPTLNDTDPTHAINYISVAEDTLNFIGAALSLQQNYATGSAPVSAWPSFRDQVVVSGIAISIPVASMTVVPGDSVDQLANRSIVNAGSLSGILTWIGTQVILSPLALITLPSVGAVTGTDGTTLADIALKFGLAISDLGDRIATTTIFADAANLSIDSLPVQGIDALVTQVLAGDAPAQISGMSSRFLLAGLRLPAPETNKDGQQTATGPLTSINDLTGQQFAGPTPDPAQPAVVALSAIVTVNTDTGWIELGASKRIAEDGQLPSGFVLERGTPIDTSRLRAGMIVRTDTATELTFSYTNAQLVTNYPPNSLEITPTSGPVALPLADQVPRTYGLDQRIEVQSPLQLPIPIDGTVPLTGNASVWPFPESLLRLARAQSNTLYDIVLATAGSDATNPPDTLQSCTFATMLPFTIKRLAGRDHVFEVLGATTDDRQTLLQLWQYIAKETTPKTQAFLMVAPAPNAGNTSGLGVLETESALTYILKTNESTETVAGASLSRRDAPVSGNAYFASFTHLATFLQLLWEASITGGSGYFMGFSTTDGKDLPASSFDEHGNVALYLLTIAGSQQAAAPTGRTLLKFNNCAAIAPVLDASTTSLWIEAADESDLMNVALVPPGNVGYDLTLPKPLPTNTIATLFSLATSTVPSVTGGNFVMPPSGLPTPPTATDGQGLSLWRRRRRARQRRAGLKIAGDPATNDFWQYQQVIPIARFGPTSAAPPAPALPDPATDPYRGVGSTTLAKPVIQLGFADVFGNITAPSTSTAPVLSGAFEAPTGYTDALLGISGWPATTSRFNIAKPSTDVMLTVTLAPQAGATAPAPAVSPLTAIEAATRQAGKYNDVFFQLSQPGLTASLLTSLEQTAGVPTPITLPLYPLWAFATAQYVASTAASLVTPVNGNGTLQQVCTTYGVSFSDLAGANASEPIVQIFGSQTLTVPAYTPFAAGQTANSIVATVEAGWPAPATGTALLTLTENANVLPLRLGTVLSIPSTNVTVPPVVPPALTISLADLAATIHTTAGLLATDNATATGKLTSAFMFVMDGLGVTVGVTEVNGAPVATFADAVDAFASVGVNCTVAELGAENGSIPGMLIESVSLASLHYVVQPDDTLAVNESGATLSDLTNLNAATPDLFDAGAAVYLGDFSPSPSTGSAGLETLRDFADRYAVPLPLLLSANPTAILPISTKLLIPGTVNLPTATITAWVPYSIATNDTLDNIADRFLSAPGTGSAAFNLATANQFLPGVMAANQTVTITIGGTPYSTTTQPGQSLNAVLLALQALNPAITFADLISQIEPTAGYLAASALLLCPPAKLAGTSSNRLTPSAAVNGYNVDALSFAQANCGVLGLVAANVSLTDTSKTVTITTGSNDTFNSLVSRFAAAGTAVGITEILSANSTISFLNGGASALLPPAPATLQVSLGTASGPFALPNFPLTVSLVLTRPSAVISPEFATTNGPVERSESNIPAPISPGADGQSLAAFAAAFETAIPTLWLSTGKVSGADSNLWVVDFGSAGISNVTVAPPVNMDNNTLWPRFMSLRPLYTDLINRPGVIVPAVQANGTLLPGSPMDFHAVDVETAAQRFLADIDLFLTGPYATGIYANTTAQSALTTVLNNKSTLSTAIPKALMTVLDVTDSGATAGLQAAAKTLTQQLGSNLSSAYSVSSILQYQATVTSPWVGSETLKPARLSGNAIGADSTDDSSSKPFTLTNAKVALDQATSPVTFMMRVPDPAYAGAVEANLDYGFLDLEFDIADVKDTAGYVSSNWLAFVPRISSTAKPDAVQFNFGTANVPIPLRAYPPAPVLLRQNAKASTPSTTPALAQLPLWTFGLSYAYQHLAQDEVMVKATFNITPPTLKAKLGVDPGDVATPLCRYLTVADQLWALLSGFADATLNVPVDTLANAAQSFAELSTEVATAWAAKTWPIQSSDAWLKSNGGAVAQVFSFRVRIGYKLLDGVDVLDTLTLAADQTRPGPTGNWPNAFCQAPDASQVELTAGTPAANVLIYQFPATPVIPAGEWPHITLEWPGLNAATINNARASMAVRRNQKLLGETGPSTNAGFLYQTPLIDAPEIITPLLEWPQRTDITALGATVTAALQSAFTTLFGATANLPISIAVLYGYEIVPPSASDPEGLVTYLPVTLFPNQTLTSQTAAEIAAALAAWQKINPPAHSNGEWVFALSLYSPLTPSSKQMLLTIERLIFRMTT